MTEANYQICSQKIYIDESSVQHINTGVHVEQVTIVVPYYNVEKYIGACLDSLLNQTHENIEILCVDDCSTDESLSVVEDYASKDVRLKIIKHTENKGLGGSRTTGIRYANSDYICFLDSDDYVSERFVEVLYKSITNEKSDVVVCNMLSDNEGFVKAYGADYENDKHLINTNKSNVLEIAMRFNPGCANKMYRRDLLIQNNIYQPEHCYYEDVVFWLKSVHHSRKISSVSDRLYYYRQRSNSIMNTLSYEHIDDRMEFIRQIDAFVKKDIMRGSNAQAEKVMRDAMIYILRHLVYGKKLINESVIENKSAIDKYYESEIVRFTTTCNWPELISEYKYHQQKLTDK